MMSWMEPRPHEPNTDRRPVARCAALQDTADLLEEMKRANACVDRWTEWDAETTRCTLVRYEVLGE
jgi:hypothetical protein